jgi:Tat protein secretion system quality control protein TatD with DNase activity
VHTAKRISDIKGLTLAEVGATTSQNARVVFGIE